MGNDIHEVSIVYEVSKDREHYVVHVNGKFFCTADTYGEALNELRETYGTVGVV